MSDTFVVEAELRSDEGKVRAAAFADSKQKYPPSFMEAIVPL